MRIKRWITVGILIIASFLIAAAALLLLLFDNTGPAANAATLNTNAVPSTYVDDVQRAGSLCPEITPPLIAAQIQQESGWQTHAESTAAAKGISQFIDSTWASMGKDGDGDGIADVNNPHDAIYSQGLYMCDNVNNLKPLLASGDVSGDLVSLALAAYNAGEGAVDRYNGVPPYAETLAYVQRIRAAYPFDFHPYDPSATASSSMFKEKGKPKDTTLSANQPTSRDRNS